MVVRQQENEMQLTVYIKLKKKIGVAVEKISNILCNRSLRCVNGVSTLLRLLRLVTLKSVKCLLVPNVPRYFPSRNIQFSVKKYTRLLVLNIQSIFRQIFFCTRALKFTYKYTIFFNYI